VTRLIGALLALALVAAGCGKASSSDPSITSTTASKPTSTSLRPNPDGFAFDVVATVTERNTSPAANGVAVNEVVEGTTDFAIDFFHAAAGDGTENVVIGNYSLSTALLLTMAGTSGSTTDGFAELLGVEAVDPTELHPAVNAIDLILEGRAEDGLDITTANKLFVQDGLQLTEEFLDTAVGSYGAPVAAVDFGGQAAVDAVNGWVADETNGFIEKLTDSYDPFTVIVLANAMYLRASWGVEFHRVEEPGNFLIADGSTVKTEMMRHDEYLPTNFGPDWFAVELPYEGGNLSMVVVEPENLARFEADLTAESLKDITDGLQESGIHLSMPIWSTETRMDALDSLHAMGLPTTYDFSAMFEGGGSGFFIDKVDHVARIDVDEKGTTAAAATGVAIAGSHGPTVNIDRPFFYFIRDRGSGAILFMGHVANPTVD